MNDAGELPLRHTISAFIRLGRPQFLVGGFAAYGLGVAIARAAGADLNWTRCAVGQLAVTCFQLMTHYANDYFDFESDRSNRTPTRWSGGSRVLPAQESMRPAALAAALGLLGLGIACGCWLFVNSTGLVVPGLLIAIPTLAWMYSAPPVRLHSRGVGEAAAAIVVAALVPWLGCAVQDARPTLPQVLAVLPLVLIQCAMLVVIDVPDQRADARTGKRTLVVRLGLSASAALHNTLLLSAYLLLVVLAMLGIATPALSVIVLTAPLACTQVLRIARRGFYDQLHWEGLAFSAVALVLLSTLAEAVGFLNVKTAGVTRVDTTQSSSQIAPIQD